MYFKSILNAELLKQVMKKNKICDHVSDWNEQVRVGDIGRAMQLVGNYTHFHAIRE